MSEIITFKTYEVDFYEFKKKCTDVFSRLHYLYAKEEKNLDDYEKALYKRVQKILPNILNNSWLNIKEQQLFLEKLNSFYMLDSSIWEVVSLMNYVYLSEVGKSAFLKLNEEAMSIIIEALSINETSYTGYEKITKIILKPEFMDKLLTSKRNRRDVLVCVLEEVDFKKSEDIALTRSIECLDERNNIEDPTYERNMDSIYEYFYTQMNGMNYFSETHDGGIVFSKDKIDKLKYILKFKHLDFDRQECFYDTIDALGKNYGLIQKCDILINIIDIYKQYLKDEKIVSFNLNGGSKK